MARGKKRSFEDELAALDVVARAPGSDEARARLAEGLASKRGLVAARAARLVKEHALPGFERALADAFARFLVDADPVCQAKLAAIEALDYAESGDAEPFLRAARHVQLEGGNDSAAPLRARAVLALARLGHPDFDLVAATLLADRVANVRQAALDALAHRGDRANAALALLKLGAGDAEPAVVLASMTTLLALAPAHALGALRDALDGDDAARAELAAVALGQSRLDNALTVLLDALARRMRAEEREPLIRAIALHRTDRALSAILAIVSDGAPDDARTAIEALVPRRFDPGLIARVRAAAAANDRADLAPLVDDLFR